MKASIYVVGEYSPQTIDSIFSQTFTDFELLENVKTTQDDKRIRLVIEAGLNGVLKASEGEYFIIAHSGDIWNPDYLEKVIAKMDSNPVYGMVTTHASLIDSEGNPTENPALSSLMIAANRSQEEWKEYCYSGNWFRGTLAFRKSLCPKEFDESLKHFAELEYIVRLLKDVPIYIIQEVLEKIPQRGNEGHYDYVHDLGVIQRRHYRMHTAESLKGKLKLIICTPFYQVKGFSPYIRSLWDTQKYLYEQKIDVDFWTHDGDSYVDRARNTICAKFLESDATHLLLIDSDESWNPEAIKKMIEADKEVIGGSYPMKNNWDLWSCIPTTKDGRIVGEINGKVGLPEAEVVSAGFMLIKRSALEKFEQHYHDLCYAETSADNEKKTRGYIAFFECCRIEGVRKGEDTSFSMRYKAMGEKLYIYPDIDFGHFGVKGWFGNYDKYLRGIK